MVDFPTAWGPVDPLLWTVWMALLGACAGSFINVVALYWPARMKAQWNQDVADYLERPATDLGLDTTPPPAPWRRRSACPACGTTLSAWQLVPLLSFVLLRGRCRACGTQISWRYPMVEACAGGLFAALAWNNGPSGWTAAMALVLSVLLLLTLIDLDHLLLPDEFTLPLMWAGLIWHATSPGIPVTDAVYGAAAGYFSLWLVYQLFKVFTGKEGMGYGDFKLLAALGAWLGWQALLPIVLVGSVTGSIWGMAQIALKRQARAQPIPFGPWLALGGVLEILQINPIRPLWTQLLNV